MLLSQEEIQEKLKNLRNWGLFGDSIKKHFSFNDFEASLVFVNKVGELAAKDNHHPDINIRYSEVTLVLTTHSEGGITEKDFSLANKIDELEN